MSDMSQGPGWWIASDGKWYPPHLHPSVHSDPPDPGADHLSGSSSATLEAGAQEAGVQEAGAQEAAVGRSPEVPSRFVGPAAFRGPDPTLGPEAVFGPVPDLPSAGEPERKRSPAPFAAAVGVVVLLLVVAGVFVIFGGSKSASATVVDAVNSTLGDKTAQITMNEAINAGPKTLTAKGTGAIDFTHGEMQVSLTTTVDGQTIPIEAENMGGIFYEKIPGLGQILPGKSWVSIDVSSLKSASAATDPSAQSAGANPSVMLRVLAQQGNKVVALGPSTLNGVAVNGYAVTADPSTVSDELKRADLPAWMRQAVAGLKTQTIGLKVFIDGSGLLRALEYQITESKGASGPITIDETLGFSHYGTTVSVTAPPADQVASFEQLLQAEQAQVAPLT